MRYREHHPFPTVHAIITVTVVVVLIGLLAFWFVPFVSYRVERCKAVYGADAGYSLVNAQCTLRRPLL